jgi:urease accessory protein
MSVAAWSSEGMAEAGSLAAMLAPVRASGRVALTCAAGGDKTHIVDLAERGGYRVKFPATASPALEPVIINTGGGVAGGDQIRFDITARAGAEVAVSTATAERVYRSIGPATEVDIRLEAGDGAMLSWLPQATILFSGARLKRRFDVDVSDDARLLMAEATVFGRTASGEVMGAGLFHDTWRVERDGRLLFAETTRLDGQLGELLARTAVMGGARCAGLLLYVDRNAEDAIGSVRAALAGSPAVHGVSAWRGMLVLRVLATGLADALATLRRAAETLTRSAVPRVWAS